MASLFRWRLLLTVLSQNGGSLWKISCPILWNLELWSTLWERAYSFCLILGAEVLYHKHLQFIFWIPYMFYFSQPIEISLFSLYQTPCCWINRGWCILSGCEQIGRIRVKRQRSNLQRRCEIRGTEAVVLWSGELYLLMLSHTSVPLQYWTSWLYYVYMLSIKTIIHSI